MRRATSSDCRAPLTPSENRDAKCGALLCASFDFPVDLQIAVGNRPRNRMASPTIGSKTTSSTPERSGKRTLSDVLIGPPRDVRDPEIFHSLSLIAFLAWVGLGSDGLSSSCYGPEEAFLALGHHQYLAVFLALMTAITVFVIATTLLGAYPGVISGCALVVDYVLTVSISIASGADAIYSFLPIGWGPWKL